MTRKPTKDIRVLLVGPVPLPYGGIATYVKDLSEAQIEGVTFRVYDTTFPTWVAPLDRFGSLYRDSFAANGLFVTLKIVLYVLLSYPVFFFRLLRERPDIVHVFPSSHLSYWRNWFYILIAKAMGYKTIFHLLNAIDMFYGRVGAFQQWLLRVSFKSADAYMVQSKGLQAWLEQHCPKPCYGFLNGLHLDQIPATCPIPPAVADLDTPRGLTIGMLGRHKGTPQILEALSRLRQKGYDLGWVFVGMGDAEKYRQQARELEVSDLTLFTGPVSDEEKWHYLLSTDFYALPSDAEGQPISILEAMAVGQPIIATAVGSIPEVIAEGETGFVIPVDDEDALDEAIIAMLADDRRKAMGAAAEAYLVEHHNIQHLFRQIGEVYYNLQQRKA